MKSSVMPVRHTFLAGKWMPRDRAVLAGFLKDLLHQAQNSVAPLEPTVQQLMDLILADAKAYMYFTQMFQQVPWWLKYSPGEEPQIRSWQDMIRMFNVLMTRPPAFNDSGLVGFPFNAILDWSMATVGGWAGFLDTKINTAMRNMLNAWGTFLKSPDSCGTLNTDAKSGWFSDAALRAMVGAGGKPGVEAFAREFTCDPEQPHFGFASWDDFFTRTFRDGVRPVGAPGDDDVIVNACESAPYRIARDVKLRDRFWLKGQPYALQFMLDNDPLTEQFVGGTIYQAFLSATSYHRWHMPVSGTIRKIHMVEGTYYSETLAMGEDPSGPNESQGYITELATRALIFIEADNPKIGLMCFVAVGMAEVSTCDVTVLEGQHFMKGEPLGMFHFGGSTHCLIFRPEVQVKFLMAENPGLDAANIPLRAALAIVG